MPIFDHTEHNQLRDRLIDALAKHVPHDGWTQMALSRAAQDIDVSEDLAQTLFDEYPIDLSSD